MVRTSSSDVASSLIAAHGLRDQLGGGRPTMWTPRTSSYFFSATIFTNPDACLRMRALPMAENGNLPTTTS